MTDIGLLILRLCFGGTLLLNHGLQKLLNFQEMVAKFPDPLHITPKFSLGLAVFAEVVCAFLCVIGLFTRLAAIPVVISMVIIFLFIHGDDPFEKKELALMYMGAFSCMFFLGPGLLSIDRK